VTSVTAWYIRHGHNPANQAHQLPHKVIDCPLTDLGATQATALAAQLARQPGPAAIYAYRCAAPPRPPRSSPPALAAT
jgi:broad specificity phosphatase PhoE